MKTIITSIINKIKAEPAVAIGAVAGVIVALAAHFGVVLDVSTVQAVIAAVIPLVTGVLTRFVVTPAAKASVVVTPGSGKTSALVDAATQLPAPPETKS